MNEATNESVEKKRNRLLAFSAAAMFAVAVGVFGGLAYLQNQARSSAVAQAAPQGSSQAYQVADLAPERKAEYVAYAMRMREKMRPWAMKHKAELSRMLHSQATDVAAYNAVWNVIEVDPRKMGLAFQDLGLAVGKENPFNSITFTWASFSKTSTPAKIGSSKLPPKVKETVESGEKQLTRDRAAAFSKQRDIILSESMTPRTQICVWVSGRVTERTTLPPEERLEVMRKFAAEGRPFTMADSFTPDREIAPAYDFLR